MAELRERLQGPRPLLLDGATGTELERRGARAGLPLWSTHALLECPDLVAEIHAEYVAAGAELLTANSFRTQERTLARAGLGGEAPRLTALAVELARRAARGAGHPVWVLGSAPPLEDCFRPDLVPDAAAMAREHGQHASNLAAAGADGILVETMNTLREAVAAVRAARETGLPVVVSFVCGDGARLLSGEALGDAVDAVAREAPDLVAVNCLPARRVPACLQVLRRRPLAFGVYANMGDPEQAMVPGDVLTPDALAALGREWLAAGARLIGGCCGTTPAHVGALAGALDAA